MNTTHIARPATAPLGTTVIRSDRVLRTALRLDAVGTFTAGALIAATGSLVDTAIGIPAAVLHTVGAFLVVYATAVGVLSFRPVISRAGAWAVVVVNAVWVLDSAVVLAAGLWPVTAVGVGAIIFIAVVVAAFAEWQYVGLRRMK